MDTVKAVGEEAVKLERKVEKTIEKKLTVLWDEIEAWQQDNHYIHSGYRPASGSYWQSWKSLGYVHNETVNIYTHLGGAVVAALLARVLYDTLAPRYQTATDEDVLVFGCFFFGAIACLGISGSYHTLCNHSPEVSRWGNHLDYMGIVFLIWGSFIPSIYYGFYGDPTLVRTYWTMITTVGMGTATVALLPKFRTPQWRPFRAFMFVLMGMSAVFPLGHGLYAYGLQGARSRIALLWVVAQGLMYIAGAGIYAARVPERWAPGRFDIWGSSHQIFHVLVLVAAATHLVGVIRAFDYRHGQTEYIEGYRILDKSWISGFPYAA